MERQAPDALEVPSAKGFTWKIVRTLPVIGGSVFAGRGFPFWEGAKWNKGGMRLGRDAQDGMIHCLVFQ